MPELTPPQRNAQDVLAAILKEEQAQTKLLKPISTIAKLMMAVLLIAVIIGALWLALLIMVGLSGI